MHDVSPPFAISFRVSLPMAISSLSDPTMFLKYVFSIQKVSSRLVSFVTTMKTAENGRPSVLHLIRSYDHDWTISPIHSREPTPGTNISQNRENTNQSQNNTACLRRTIGIKTSKRRRQGLRDINYEKAQDLEVWQVARAATAAKFYFEPLGVANHVARDKLSFTDGGIGLTSNPTQEAKREIEELHGQGSIGIIISVGTARKRSEETQKTTFFTTLPRAVKAAFHKMTDPERTHEELRLEHENEETFSYYRLNQPGGLKTEPDEWEPKQGMFGKESGLKTIATIRAAFNEWLEDVDNVQQLQQCATELVQCRRARSETARWERYATGCQFKCRIRRCPYGDFYDSNMFRNHLRRHHSIEEKDLDELMEICGKRWRYQERSPA